MIVRLIVIDPSPPPGRTDTLVYQVPEHSRELELLVSLFTQANIESVVVEIPRRKKNSLPT